MELEFEISRRQWWFVAGGALVVAGSLLAFCCLRTTTHDLKEQLRSRLSLRAMLLEYSHSMHAIRRDYETNPPSKTRASEERDFDNVLAAATRNDDDSTDVLKAVNADISNLLQRLKAER